MKKKSFYLFAMMMVVALCVGFTSCGDDDDDDGPGSGSASALVGTWQHLGREIHYSDGTVYFSDAEKELDAIIYIHFNADWTGAMYIHEYWKDSWSKDLLKYQLDGKKLTFQWLSDEFSSEIVSLSKSELKLREADDDDSYYSILTLKKVADSVIAGAEE